MSAYRLPGRELIGPETRCTNDGLSDQSVQSEGQGDANKGHGDQQEACLEEFSLQRIHE
jgi:hypothetical protein